MSARPTTKSDAAREFDAAMADRENPSHPMFRCHNCWKCDSGETPCVQGDPSQCEFPHARND